MRSPHVLTTPLRAAVIICFVSIGLAACDSDGGTGNAPSKKSSDGGADANGKSKDAVGNNDPSCPAAEPAEGGACDKADLLCEYGENFNALCNEVYVCSAGGTWARPIFGGAAPADCSKPSFDSNPNDCAATYAEVPTGESCDTDSVCNYTGAQCGCYAFCPQFPVGLPDCNPDAGINENCCDSSDVRWNCEAGPSYCPDVRPAVGTACEGDQSCALEPPKECGQTRLVCRDNRWTVTSGDCPISTASAKRDIQYVSEKDLQTLESQLMSVRLATYKYRNGSDGSNLGFIIEDMPLSSPAVTTDRGHVNLYGYMSMAVATLQRQNAELAELRKEVERLKTNQSCE